MTSGAPAVVPDLDPRRYLFISSELREKTKGPRTRSKTELNARTQAKCAAEDRFESLFPDFQKRHLDGNRCSHCVENLLAAYDTAVAERKPMVFRGLDSDYHELEKYISYSASGKTIKYKYE